MNKLIDIDNLNEQVIIVNLEIEDTIENKVFFRGLANTLKDPTTT